MLRGPAPPRSPAPFAPAQPIGRRRRSSLEEQAPQVKSTQMVGTGQMAVAGARGWLGERRLDTMTSAVRIECSDGTCPNGPGEQGPHRKLWPCLPIQEGHSAETASSAGLSSFGCCRSRPRPGGAGAWCRISRCARRAPHCVYYPTPADAVRRLRLCRGAHRGRSCWGDALLCWRA